MFVTGHRKYSLTKSHAVQMSVKYSLITHHDLIPLPYHSRAIHFVNMYVEFRIKVHFSAASIAVCMKPCIVIAIDIRFSEPVPVTYILRSIDFVNIYFDFRNKVSFSTELVVVSVKTGTVIALDIH